MVRIQGGAGTSDPGRVTFLNISVMGLLTQAYPNMYRIYGPDWLDKERFDVIGTMPPDTTKQQFAIMVRNLLLDRFAVKSHQELKEFDAYDLVVDKGGPKLKRTTRDPASQSVPSRGGGPPQLDDAGFPVLPRPGLISFNTYSGGIPL